MLKSVKHSKGCFSQNPRANLTSKMVADRVQATDDGF